MYYEDREQLEKWAQIIEKATADGKFKNAAGATPSPKTSEESFFGLQNTHPTDRPSAEDVKYWNQVSKKSENPSVLNESIDPKMAREWRRHCGLSTAADKKIVESNEDVANVAKSIAQSPNPIRTNTVGQDQALEPGPLGLTFSEEDIKNLDALKIQLYEMECKLNDFEGRGQNASKFEKQIQALKAKIDDLSTAMTQSFPYSISSQGD
jgi:hypothetical protein